MDTNQLPRHAANNDGNARPHATDNHRTTSNATTVGPHHEDEKGTTIFKTTTRTARPIDMPVWTLVSLGGLIFGYGGIGQIGGFLAMADYSRRFGDVEKDGQVRFSDTRQGTIVGLLMVGALVGSLGAGRIADRIGRKHSICIWAIVYIVGQLVEITSFNTWFELVIGRVIEGLGIGGLSIIVPMYMGETALKEVRGVIISIYQFFITFGILLASAINLGTHSVDGSSSWRITMGVGLLWPVVLAIGALLLDESPRWDVRRDSTDSAAATLAKLYSTSSQNQYVQEELQEIQESIRVENLAGEPGFFQLFKEPTILRRFIVGMVIQAMQQLTGINYFFYFGTQIFADLDVGDSYATSVILAAVNFVFTFAGLWITQRFGHRIVLILGGFEIGAALLFYAFFGSYCVDNACGINPSATGAVMVTFTCLAIIGFATSWGPLAWVVCAEIYPIRWRGLGMGVATATNWSCNFLIGFVTPLIVDAIRFRLGFVFAAAIITGAWFVFFFVHETAGKSLEAIDREILDKVKPWHSKK